MLDEINGIKSGDRELREFGIVIGAILIALGDLALWSGRGAAPYLISGGALLFGLGLAAPSVLFPLQKAWMALGVILGFLMSRLILFLLFYAVMTPIGLVMKLAGKDILDGRIDRKRPSYWHESPAAAKPKESYENQY